MKPKVLKLKKNFYSGILDAIAIWNIFTTLAQLTLWFSHNLTIQNTCKGMVFITSPLGQAEKHTGPAQTWPALEYSLLANSCPSFHGSFTGMTEALVHHDQDEVRTQVLNAIFANLCCTYIGTEKPTYVSVPLVFRCRRLQNFAFSLLHHSFFIEYKVFPPFFKCLIRLRLCDDIFMSFYHYPVGFLLVVRKKVLEEIGFVLCRPAGSRECYNAFRASHD